MAFKNNKQIGIVVYGTAETDHDLVDEEGYENIYALKALRKPDVSFVKDVSAMERTNIRSDGMLVVLYGFVRCRRYVYGFFE